MGQISLCLMVYSCLGQDNKLLCSKDIKAIMKYLLFANNAKLKQISSNCNLLQQFYSSLPEIEDKDMIMTFNHALPMTTVFPNLQHPNIHHLSRVNYKAHLGYSGLNIISKFKNKYKKIYLTPSFKATRKTHKDKVGPRIEDESDFKIKEFDYLKELSQKAPLLTECRGFLHSIDSHKSNFSTGLIGYLWVKTISDLNIDEIYLIGYEMKMNYSHHNPLAETEYFSNEFDKGYLNFIDLKV